MARIFSINFKTNDFTLHLDHPAGWAWLRIEKTDEKEEINVSSVRYTDNNGATTYLILTEKKAEEFDLNRSILIAAGDYMIMSPYKIIGFSWCCGNEEIPMIIVKVKKQSGETE